MTGSRTPDRPHGAEDQGSAGRDQRSGTYPLAPRAVGRVLPLRHDALKAHLASVREHERAVLLVQVLIEARPGRRASEQAGKRCLAHRQKVGENDAPFGYPTHDANAGGEPSAGCRCQSMDVFGSPFRRLRNPRENLDSISYGSGIRTRSLWKRGVGFLGGRLLFLECLIYRLDRIVAENPPYQFATVP
jgi:hypothetical protein